MTVGRTNTRDAKILCSATFLFTAIFMSYPGFFGRRTRGDEANLAIDIHHLLQNGAVTDFAYGAGQAYLTFVPTLLRVLGVPYSTTNALSPFIAALCLSAMVVFLYLIYRRESQDWIGVIPLATGFLPFAAFIGVLSETSHKALIYTIVFMSLYLTWRFYRGQYDRRHTGLLVGALCALSFFNIYWGTIYSGAFVLGILFEGVAGRRTQDLKYFLALPAVNILTIVAFFPTVTKAPVVILVRARKLFASTATISGSATSAGGFITDWPMIAVFGNEISIWFIYTTGIFIIGALSATAFVIALSQVAKRKTKPLDRLVVVILPTFGTILIGMAAAGSLPAFRRLLVFPGIVGLLCWMVYLSNNRTSLSSPNKHTIMTVATVFLICTSAFLAVPRLTPDGTNNPYDKFSDRADISRVSFAFQEYPSDCLESSEEHDVNIAKIVFGKPLFSGGPLSPPELLTRDKVYTAKSESGLYC